MSQKRYKNFTSSEYNFDNNIRAMHQLSPYERQSVKQLGNPLLIEKMIEGDNAYNEGKIIKEAERHRFVQEELRHKKIIHKDDESLLAYAYNSALVHNKQLVKIGLEKGLSFNDMFSLQINNNPSKGQRKYNYQWIVPDNVIPTFGLYQNGTSLNNYHNSNYNNYYNSLQSNGFSRETNDLVYGLQKMLGHI